MAQDSYPELLDRAQSLLKSDPAGADAIDLSMDPVSGGTSQPDFIVMWHALRGTEYELGSDGKVIDVDKVVEALALADPEAIEQQHMRCPNPNKAARAISPGFIKDVRQGV